MPYLSYRRAATAPAHWEPCACTMSGGPSALAMCEYRRAARSTSGRGAPLAGRRIRLARHAPGMCAMAHAWSR